jgi:hypothetical protein
MPEKREVTESFTGEVSEKQNKSIPVEQEWIQAVLAEQNKILKDIKISLLGTQIYLILVIFLILLLMLLNIM